MIVKIIRLFSKGLLLPNINPQSGLERKALDSCGISWTDETPQERSDEEAHRQPRGKQVPVAERNGPFQKTTNFTKTAFKKTYENILTFHSIGDV
ncbi:hypothetical protein B5V89_05660 [Heyndrickxia sporothermodurans]|nr:hypothetical protein B5V89_05660 [Heyndrickxia sporothermodurans]